MSNNTLVLDNSQKDTLEMLKSNTVPVDKQTNVLEIWRFLTPAEMAVYIALIQLGGYIKQAEIMNATQLSRVTVSSACKKLETFNVIHIDRNGPHHTYFVYSEYKSDANHVFTSQDSILNTNTLNNNIDKQMTLIENNNNLNLGLFDINSQQNLNVLKIKELKQIFSASPQLAKQYTPSQILMFHDHDGSIASNLEIWAEAYRRGMFEITSKLKPALIWCKILEGTPPPAVEPTPPAVEPTPPAVEPTPPAVEPTPPAVEPTPPAAVAVWEQTKLILKGQMAKSTFNTWLRNTTAIIHDDVYTIVVKNQYAKEWLTYRLTTTILRALNQVLLIEEIKFITVKELNYEYVT